LAKPAAAYAAAKHLAHRAVMHGFNQRHREGFRKIAVVQILHNAFFHHALRHTGHVAALKLRGGLQKLAPASFIYCQQIQQLTQHFFALANHEQINKRRKGSGVASAGSACDDDGMAVIALGRTQRQPCQIKHVEYIAVAKFVLQRKAQ
jgi:hypothetical protein